VTNVAAASVIASTRDRVDPRGPIISHYGDRYREAYAAKIRHLVAVTHGQAPRWQARQTAGGGVGTVGS